MTGYTVAVVVAGLLLMAAIIADVAMYETVLRRYVEVHGFAGWHWGNRRRTAQLPFGCLYLLAKWRIKGRIDP